MALMPKEQPAHHRADRSGDASQQATVLGHLHQTEEERHHTDQADGQSDRLTRVVEDRVGQRLHLAGPGGEQDRGQNDEDEDAVQHGRLFSWRHGTRAGEPLSPARWSDVGVPFMFAPSRFACPG